MVAKLAEAFGRTVEEMEKGGGAPLGRRGFFALGAAAAGTAIASAAGGRGHDDEPAPAPTAGPGGAGLGISQNWKDPAVRLARRISMGLTPELVAEAKSLGFQGFLNKQLAYETIDDSACESYVQGRWPRVNMSAAQLRPITDDWVTSNHLVEAGLYRATNSKRQLFERMVEFWTDHFNVWMDVPGGGLMVGYLKDAIRRNAMGNFRMLVRAVCFNPAMLTYLNNDRNRCANPNVNFARELMELHTIGVDAGYTQQDILSVSLAFTGWRWEWDRNNSKWGTFIYDHDAHAVGAKVVLGQIVPNGARDEGEKIIDLLVAHPACSRFIAKKLCWWFLGREVSQTVIDAAAAEFRRTGGNIRAVLRKILTAPNLMAAVPKYKRPFHLIVSGLRSCRAQMTGDLWNLRIMQLDNAGHYTYAWQTPDGYPDRMDFWVTNAAPRLNFAFQLPSGWVSGVQVDIPAMVGLDRDPDRVRDIFNRAFFGGEMANADRDALEQFLRGGLLDDPRLRAAAALCMASPSFQWY
jgi:uncharacterized protein (DUF1800 family)